MIYLEVRKPQRSLKYELAHQTWDAVMTLHCHCFRFPSAR